MITIKPRHVDCGCGCTARAREEAWEEWALEQEAENFPLTIECHKHGMQEVVETQEFTGFAGGACVAYTLVCGHNVVDESADVRAAE